MKKKSLYKENFSHIHSVGGVVTQKPWATNLSLSKLVKEKYGSVDEDAIDVKGLTKKYITRYDMDENVFETFKAQLNRIGEIE